MIWNCSCRSPPSEPQSFLYLQPHLAMQGIQGLARTPNFPRLRELRLAPWSGDEAVALRGPLGPLGSARAFT